MYHEVKGKTLQMYKKEGNISWRIKNIKKNQMEVLEHKIKSVSMSRMNMSGKISSKWKEKIFNWKKEKIYWEKKAQSLRTCRAISMV